MRSCRPRRVRAVWVPQIPGDVSFAFLDPNSLEQTRRNIATPAELAGDAAYWADESALTVLQTYLHVHLLIFDPKAAPANRCACLRPPEPLEPLEPPVPPVPIAEAEDTTAAANGVAANGVAANGVAAAGGAPGPAGLSYIVLRHSHKVTKEQYYDLYGMHGSRRAVFEEASLPAGIKRAFASCCPWSASSWKAAVDAHARASPPCG